jgi:hypothetical protein
VIKNKLIAPMEANRPELPVLHYPPSGCFLHAIEARLSHAGGTHLDSERVEQFVDARAIVPSKVDCHCDPHAGPCPCRVWAEFLACRASQKRSMQTTGSLRSRQPGKLGLAKVLDPTRNDLPVDAVR